jgi:hypothetical protein
MALRFSEFLFLLMFSQSLFGQLQINWQQCFCSMDHDYAYDIAQTDGGYLVVGMQEGGDGQVTCTEEPGIWLLKINHTGNLIWEKCYEHAAAYRMTQAFGNSYYYLMGATISEPYPDVPNLWISKMDSTGSFIWERTLGNNTGISDYNFYSTSTKDGGVIASVDIFSQGGDITNWYGGYDGWIIKLNSLGNTEWDFTIGSANTEWIIGISQTKDNGYIAAAAGSPDGTTGNIPCTSFTPGFSDAIIYKLDSLGNPEWHRCYGGSYNDVAISIFSLDDGYLIAGGGESADGDLTGSGWHGGHDVWLIRTDLSGDIIWQKCYGGSNDDDPVRIFQTSDDGFMVFGNTKSLDGDVVGNPSLGSEPSIWVFKIDSSGQLQWQQCIGGTRTERVYGVIQNGDYDYTLAGEMFYSPSGDVNCSNFIYGSRNNYWVFGISDTIVNVNEPLQLNDKIKIYPNPANSVLNIDFPDDYNAQNTIIELLDINGKLMLKSETVTSSTQIKINHLNSGFYIVKVQNDNTLITKRIIIK